MKKINQIIKANEFLPQLSDGAAFNHIEIHNMDLSQTKAFELVFQHCKFVNIDMNNVDWEKISCHSSEFINCRFIDATLEDATFDKCLFFDPVSSVSSNFIRSNLRSATFKNCDLSGCVFEGANVFRISIENSNAVGAKFFRAIFNGSAKLTKNKLKYADLRGANLSNCDVSENELTWAILDEADFTKAILVGSDLGGASVRYTKFAGADLRGAVLSSFDIRTLNISGAKILESQMWRLLENCELIIFPDSE
jgi:uncharacterized protein YjbI with pentapeptide repeats